MAIGRTNVGGGGGGLNFSVKAYASESSLPSSASENTIAVITETAITGWVADVKEPESPVDGIVWIKVGTESGVSFNALRKNALAIYPVSVLQYANGEFANMDAFIYQNGAWAQFSEVFTALYIIKDGFVDFEQYPYTYEYQEWVTNKVETFTGGVKPSAIKVSQTYNGNPALWTKSSNGYYWKNTFNSVTVPNNASTFKFEYYLLGAQDHNPVIAVGEATTSIPRGSGNKVENGIAEIDVTGLRGQTVQFTYTTYGNANTYDNYVANAWFE